MSLGSEQMGPFWKDAEVLMIGCPNSFTISRHTGCFGILMPTVFRLVSIILGTSLEPFKIKVVEPIRVTDRRERREYLEAAHYNLFALPASAIGNANAFTVPIDAAADHVPTVLLELLAVQISASQPWPL